MGTRASHNVRLSDKCRRNSALTDEIKNMSATLEGKKLGCFDICLLLADRINYLGDEIQNLSATLAGNKFELCLALVSTD